MNKEMERLNKRNLPKPGYPDLPFGDADINLAGVVGLGAKLTLISKSKREEAKAIAREVRYLELAADPHFSRTFARAMYLGKI